MIDFFDIFNKAKEHLEEFKNMYNNSYTTVHVEIKDVNTQNNKRTKKMDKITNLQDLCDYFCADNPNLLNHRIYKDTVCGASISIHVGSIKEVKNTYSLEFVQDSQGVVLKSCRKNGRFSNYSNIHVDVRHFFDLFSEHNVVRHNFYETLEKLFEACRGFSERHKYDSKETGKDFIRIKSINGNVVTVCHNHLHDNSHWLHNGDKWNVTKKTNLIGFTIQSIVEGSDVEVNSEEFIIPVSVKDVEDWMETMEKETSFYWKRDNLFHWRLTNSTGNCFFFDTGGWDDPQWHCNDKEVPINVKNKAIKWIETNLDSNFSFKEDEEYKFGVKDWTISYFIDDSTF